MSHATPPAPGDPPTLIIGGDSTIGNALAPALRSQERPVLVTSRRPESIQRGALPLDLEAAPATWQLPDLIRCAVLCTSAGNMRTCREQPEATRRLNVNHLATLSRILTDRGAFLIFLSTNQVFTGQQPLARESQLPSPRSEYGRQKADAEQRLHHLTTQLAIVRLTKVLRHQPTLFEDWQRDLVANQPVHAFNDMPFAPIALPLVTTLLQSITTQHTPGIFHLSASYEITYAEAARWLADKLQVSPDRVIPAAASASDIPAEERPPHTTLDMSNTTRQFGLKPPDPYDALNWATASRP